MRRIANTTELTTELTRLLAYAGSYQPSRVKLAASLRSLALRTAAPKPPPDIQWLCDALENVMNRLGDRVSRPIYDPQRKEIEGSFSSSDVPWLDHTLNDRDNDPEDIDSNPSVARALAGIKREILHSFGNKALVDAKKIQIELGEKGRVHVYLPLVPFKPCESQFVGAAQCSNPGIESRGGMHFCQQHAKDYDRIMREEDADAEEF